MNCRIIKDKRTGEEFLIPGCYSVANHWGAHSLTDREIIKEYCNCVREKKEKYETKSRDEVFAIIEQLKSNILKMENSLGKMKEDLYGLESEVFCLNTVEVE